MSSSISSLRSARRPRPRWVERLSHWFRPYELLTEEDAAAGKTPQFRYLPNAIEVWGLFAVAMAAIRFLAPGFWHSQLRGGPVAFAVAFVLLGFVLTGPAEWFFHRFMLHGLLAYRYMPWLKIRREEGSKFARSIIYFQNSMTISTIYYIAKMAFAHGAHHKITDVTPMNPDRLAKLFRVRNRYEIVSNEQTEHAVFPHFSIFGFWLFFLPAMAVVQVIANFACSLLHAPHLPMILAGLFSVSCQVWLYENSHAIMHKPYREWWRPRMQGKLTGWWWNSVYRFHFFHHMNEKCSLGVVGSVWFNYVWDRIFGTYKLAPMTVIEGASRVTTEVLELSQKELRALPEACAEDFDAPRPPAAWVRHLDRQGVIAQKMWNKLFVAALQEVRRRNGPRTPSAPAARASQAKLPRIPVTLKQQ